MKDGIKKQVTMDGACDSFSTEYVRNCVSSEVTLEDLFLPSSAQCYQGTSSACGIPLVLE